ncbi:MAG TPA: hypothetical protein VHS55_00125 [Solirubrobacteraceae bacterium]|jgi:hypothetical protein|nr:hypothetical protein [Solirubrobacteraceae bacterium]
MTRTSKVWLAATVQAVLLCACLPSSAMATATATAGTSAKLGATFIPESLGRRTTLDFSFSLSDPAAQVPPPLTEIELRYPNNLGIALSGLGLATCTAQQLESSGTGGCSPNAVMGYGEALTEILLGTTIVSESAPITILRAPDKGGRLALLFYAEGTAPVDTRVVFPGLLLPASSPFGGTVNIGVPLVPTLPGAPYISVIHLRSTIGPKGVTYYERLGNATLGYRPKGILLPNACPAGGFQFSARFGFLDGSHALAHTAIPCPAAGGAVDVRDRRR